MTEEQQKSRVDSLIGIVKALFRIDPMIALIALLIIIPVSIPVINAILQGNTEITITFVLFISGITLGVYIPLRIVSAWREKEKALTNERKEAVKREMESRMEDKKQSRERANEVVVAKIRVLEAQTRAIIENIPNFERILLQQEADKIRKSLGLELTDEASLLTRLGLVIDSFETIIKKFDNLESAMPSLQNTVEEIKSQFLNTPIPESTFVKGAASLIEELSQKLVEKEAEIESLIEENHRGAELNHQLESKISRYGPSDTKRTELEETSIHESAITQKESIPEKIKAAISVGKSKILGDGTRVIEDMTIHEVSVIPDSKEVESELSKDHSEMKAALEVVDNLEDAKPVNYWECVHCGNKNALKKVRCKCGKGKTAISS